jgi:hypothetical protein
MTSRKDHWYQRTTDDQVSPSDPDATPMKRFTGDKARLGYHTHYVVDGGQARIILSVLVTPASIMDNTPMLDLARWSRFRWHLHPAIAVGDTKYGTVANIVGLELETWTLHQAWLDPDAIGTGAVFRTASACDRAEP